MGGNSDALLGAVQKRGGEKPGPWGKGGDTCPGTPKDKDKGSMSGEGGRLRPQSQSKNRYGGKNRFFAAFGPPFRREGGRQVGGKKKKSAGWVSRRGKLRNSTRLKSPPGTKAHGRRGNGLPKVMKGKKKRKKKAPPMDNSGGDEHISIWTPYSFLQWGKQRGFRGCEKKGKTPARVGPSQRLKNE